MVSSEGSREIAAAKKRLAAAETRELADAEALDSAIDAEKSAKKMVQLAKTNADSAAKIRADTHSRLKSSAEERREAKNFLKEAEARWEVVNVCDSDSESESNGGSIHKKQKTSDAEEENFVQEAPDEIVVEGCGTAEANGTYTRQSLTYQGRSRYVKECELNGQWRRFVIYHYIAMWSIGERDPMGWMNAFYSCASLAKIPPKTGWNVSPVDGTNPAPELTW